MRFTQPLRKSASLITAALLLASCDVLNRNAPSQTQPASISVSDPSATIGSTTEAASVNTTASGLQIEDTVVGTGVEAQAGDTVKVHYEGFLTTGSKFDSSLDAGKPFEFTLGAGRVIAGWDEGVAGMKEGGQRKLTIPPALGYGSRAIGPIPANSTLIFNVTLVDVLGK